MWFVLVSKKGGYLVHSFHETEDDAKQWRACKEHDGADASIAYLEPDLVTDLATFLAERETHAGK